VLQAVELMHLSRVNHPTSSRSRNLIQKQINSPLTLVAAEDSVSADPQLYQS
jgi:hypothetical protein